MHISYCRLQKKFLKYQTKICGESSAESVYEQLSEQLNGLIVLKLNSCGQVGFKSLNCMF